MTQPAPGAREQAFVALVREHGALVHKVCYAYAHTEDDRRDLYQEVLLQCWRAFPRFQGRAEPSTWLYRIALNTAITFLRRRTRASFSELGDEALSSGPLEIERFERWEVLERAMARLGSIDRAVLLLYLEDRSYEDIGDILGLSASNVSVKLARIRSRLKDWWAASPAPGAGHGTR